MSVLDPKQDAQALASAFHPEEEFLINGLVQRVIPALGSTLIAALGGLTITITVSKK